MDKFELPVSYNGKDYSFPTRIIKQFYIEKFEVSVNEHLVFFEPDEEGKYRAILDEKDKDMHKLYNNGLFKEIAEAIQFLVNE